MNVSTDEDITNSQQTLGLVGRRFYGLCETLVLIASVYLFITAASPAILLHPFKLEKCFKLFAAYGTVAEK